MDNDIQLYDIPDGKVYQTNHIGIATFFGGIFVGAYLLAENFKVLGNNRARAISWSVAVILFIGMIFLPIFLPVLDAVPTVIYPVFYALLAGWSARRFQLQNINSHVTKGGEVYSTGRVVAVTLIGLGITVGFALLLFFIQDNLTSRHY